MKRFLVLLFILLVSAFAVFAQDYEALPNDPRVNENANACAEGGQMEGKCNVDFDGNGVVDDYEVDWAWECGWHMIRLDAGMISRASLPEDCESLIDLDISCFKLVFAPFYIEYNGNPNQEGNVTAYFGGCGHESIGGFFLGSSLIIANSLQEATDICSQFGTIVGLVPVSFGYVLSPTGEEVPEWVYGCDYIP
jgi:hypothetical protein